MEEGNFRRISITRLNVGNITFNPSCVNFLEDIPLLARYLLKKSAGNMRSKVIVFRIGCHCITHNCLAGNVSATGQLWSNNVSALTQTSVLHPHLVEQALSAFRTKMASLQKLEMLLSNQYLLLKYSKWLIGNVTARLELAGRNRTDMHKLMRKHELPVRVWFFKRRLIYWRQRSNGLKRWS